ncbi:hypothetical protein ACLOJK_022691, partial [Asimina triloba]
MARHDTGAIVVGGIISMIAMRLGVQLESPIHIRVLGNDRLDLNTLVLMKMCHREGGKYLIINEADTFVPYPPEAIAENIPLPTEENAKPSREMQRRLNPNMKEVDKKEVVKWLDA